MTIDSFRRKHPSLTYQSYEYRLQPNAKIQLQIKYQFLLEPNTIFNPQIEVSGLDENKIVNFPKPFLDNLVFQLGLAELPSYWKCACSPTIKIEAGWLSQEQTQWWHQLFLHGLGEFYFVNQIDFTNDDFLHFEIKKQPTKNQLFSSPASHYSIPYLVPVGGGKDSGLTLSLLDQQKIQYQTLVLEPASPAASKLAANSQTTRQITAKRTIDPTLIKLNSQEYLNGHTPFSAYLAFLSTLIGHLGGHQQILVANESSANQANLEYKGIKINHQWSKSFAFEKSYRQYSTKYLGSNPKQAEYMSFLRPLNELQIAKRFAKLPKSLLQFRSCNVGQKQNIWCGRCAKCAFVYLMLYPFVPGDVLSSQVFSHDLFQDNTLLSIIRALADPSQHKPLECVGTDQEVQVALSLAIKKNELEKQKLPVVLEEMKKWLFDHYSLEELQLQTQQLLDNWNKDHFLDKKLETILKTSL